MEHTDDNSSKYIWVIQQLQRHKFCEKVSRLQTTSSSVANKLISPNGFPSPDWRSERWWGGPITVVRAPSGGLKRKQSCGMALWTHVRDEHTSSIYYIHTHIYFPVSMCRVLHLSNRHGRGFYIIVIYPIYRGYGTLFSLMYENVLNL